MLFLCPGGRGLTLMRSPVGKRPTTPVSGLLAFFPLCQGRRRQPPVACPDGMAVWGPRPCGGTTHFVRRCHQGHGAGRGTSAWSAAASKLLGALVPSSAQSRLSGDRSPGRARRGGGAAHGTQTRRAPPPPAPARVAPPPPRAPGAGPRCSWAFPDAERPRWPRPRSRLTPCPSRAALGSPAPLTTPGAPWAERPPWAVGPWPPRRAPAAGPGGARRCPGRGGAAVASGPCGQREGPAAPGRPLPRRPTGERPGRSARPRGRTASPPTPARPCRGGTTRGHRRRRGPRPGTAGRREQGAGSGGGARCPRAPSTSCRRGASESSRARATARLFGTAGAGHRSAPPARWACEALGGPIAGRGA
jgi:hypothetical protein